MPLFPLLMAALFLGPFAQTSSAKEGLPSGNQHPGMSGASAAIFLDAGRVVVASDEDNRLRVYDPSASQPAITAWDASPWLRLSGRNPECDLEGAARVGNRIYWIGSHGRNKDGKYRPNRHRFFATEVMETPQGPRLRSLGSPCSTLVSALLTPNLNAPLTHVADNLSASIREGDNVITPGDPLVVPCLCPVYSPLTVPIYPRS